MLTLVILALVHRALTILISMQVHFERGRKFESGEKEQYMNWGT